jgi:predicted ATP-dependent protease
VAILAAIISAVWQIPLPQDIAVTGELSIRGNVKPVGGLHPKIYGARQAGVKKVFVPQDNWDEISEQSTVVEIVPIKTAAQFLEAILGSSFDRLQLPVAN